MNQRDALVLLDRYIRARYPVIAVQSHEESRVLTGIRAIAENRKMTLITWSLTEGLRDAEIDYEAVRNALEAHHRPERVPDFDPDMTREPAAAFEAIKASLNRKKFLFVFKDLHGNLGSRDRGFDPLYTRFLRDIAALYEKTSGNLILLSPALQIPPELDKIIALIDWPLPDTSDLAAILNKAENDLPDDFPVTLNGSRERVVQAMRGLTAFEASQVLSAGIIATRKLGDDIIPHIIREKSQIIKKSGVLEFFDTDVTMKHIGGLQHLKAYAARTRSAFSDSAREEGVDTPKGVLLVGIPGTGKSLAAKAIAGGELPLLRMDIGALMGGLVGQSESNMRSALKVAEAVAPCVTGDTYITLGDGNIIKVKDLYAKARPGERVIAVDDNVSCSVPLLAVIKKVPGDHGVYRVTTSAGEIEATGNHKLMSEFDWIEVDHIQPGLWLYMPTLKSTLWPDRNGTYTDAYIPQGAAKNSAGLWRVGHGGYTDSVLSVPPFVTANMGELLGYLESDGTISDTRITFRSSNPILLDRFEALVKTLFDLQPSRRKNSKGPGDISTTKSGNIITTRKDSYVSYISNKLLAEFLRNISSSILRFENSFMWPAYLRAFINGDGTVSRDQKRITITQIREPMRTKIQEMLRRVGVYGRFREKGLHISGWMARNLLEILQKTCGPQGDKIDGVSFDENHYGHTNGRTVKPAVGGVWVKVEKIERVEDQDVYDLSCETIHTYVSNGFVSHNCILWVDEIEKALGGSGGGELDGGTSARVFGTFLTWMQETTAPVYVVATANNFKALRPELISRFNDTFWVDLPNHASRVEILTIHLERRKRDPQAFDLDTVADALWGFSGREIEKVIKEAIGTAFFERRPVTTEDLLNAAAHIVPLLSSMKDSIDTMRRQIDNARQAGDPLEPRPFGDPQPAGVGRLDLSDL